MIRSLQIEDLEIIAQIHQKFYKDEFELPNFLNNYLCAFVESDEQGIITVGGVRTILECIAITDKDRSVKDRRKALYNILRASSYFAEKYNYNQLHAFVQDDNWVRHLNKVGFISTKGKSLILNI